MLREMIARLVDGSEFDEFKETYGQTRCSVGPAGSTAGRWESSPTSGLIVTQRKTGVEDRAISELQIGGVVYSEAADKGAHGSSSCAIRRGSPFSFSRT